MLCKDGYIPIFLNCPALKPIHLILLNPLGLKPILLNPLCLKPIHLILLNPLGLKHIQLNSDFPTVLMPLMIPWDLWWKAFKLPWIENEDDLDNEDDRTNEDDLENESGSD